VTSSHHKIPWSPQPPVISLAFSEIPQVQGAVCQELEAQTVYIVLIVLHFCTYHAPRDQLVLTTIGIDEIVFNIINENQIIQI
jgi:hypothetical protein